MEFIIQRFMLAINSKQKIGIFGDYDVDGVSGTVMLVSVLKKAGLDTHVYLPDRAKEGYGLNRKAVQEMKEWGADLILAIDCGMSDFKEADFLKELGLDLIIIDHHQPLERLPDCLAILNPHLHDSQYPFKELAATGVVFKLTQALIPIIRNECPELVEMFPDGIEKWNLDLVALATVADSMSLIGENRTLLHYGLLVLAQTKRAGLRELMDVAGVRPVLKMQAPYAAESELSSSIERRVNKRETNLNPQTIAFSLAPRLNAASRMDHADTSYELLLTEDPVKGRELAEFLDKKNRERFLVVKKIIQQIASDKDLKNQPVVLAGGKDWPIGVLGIVAGKIVEDLERPVFFYQDLGEESVGSARSLNGFNLIEAMQSCQQYLKEFGGHKAAAGFRFDSKNAPQLRQCLAEAFQKSGDVAKSEPEAVLEADLELEPADFSVALYESLRKMEPFGIGNPVPKFLLRNLKIIDRTSVGKDSQHSKLKLKADLPGGSKKEISALAFNQILPEHLKFGEIVDVIGEMLPDEYNGALNLSLKILDIQPHERS